MKVLPQEVLWSPLRPSQNLLRHHKVWVYFISTVFNTTFWNQRTTAQKMKFSIKDFFRKCDQFRRKLRIWSIYWRNPKWKTLFSTSPKRIGLSTLVKSSVSYPVIFFFHKNRMKWFSNNFPYFKILIKAP